MTRPLIGITADFDTSGSRPPRAFLYAAYYEAVLAAGGLPVVVPPPEDPAALAEVLDRLDGLIFSGGDDVHPRCYGQEPVAEVEPMEQRRERAELALARRALAGELPVLGICGGLQLLNVVSGGTLVQHLASSGPGAIVHKVPRPEVAYHGVSLQRGCRLARLMDCTEFRVYSRHHQAIARPGQGWKPVGWAADGVIEAAELAGHRWAIAVQWHPERQPEDPVQRRLLEAFVVAAASK